MKNIKIETLLIGLFLFGSLLLFGWFNMTKPSILILHSYDKDYPWVRDINVGLNRVMTNQYRYQVRWYYMDTKRHPWAEYMKSAGIAARSQIDQMHPDLIIAVDDDAQQFAAKYYANDPHTKIVFTGVNNEAADYGYDKAKNVTGLLERQPVAAIRETLLAAENFKNLGHPIRMAFIGDKSATVLGDARHVQRFDWAPVQLTEVTLLDTFPQWQAKIEALAGKADIIYLTGYRRISRSDTDKTLVPPKELVKWTEEHSKVPLICGNGFYVEEGGMLAIGTSPYEQGEAAGKMALDILLHGKQPSEVPIRESIQFIVEMREGLMKQHGFVLPKVYEAAARTGDKYFP